MGIMSLRRGHNPLARIQLSRHPERLQIGHRTAARQVSEVFLPSKHRRNLGNRLDLDPNFVPDIVATKILAGNTVPLPNQALTNRWIGNIGLPLTSNEYLIKGDFQLIPHHRTTLNYFQSIGSGA